MMLAIILTLLAFDAIQWLEAVVVPLVIALIVGIPSTLTAVRVLRENRSQHGDNADKLDRVADEVTALRSDLGELHDKVERFILRTETWRDHVDDEP